MFFLLMALPRVGNFRLLYPCCALHRWKPGCLVITLPPFPPTPTPTPLLCAPAAIDQLVTLGAKIDVPVFELGTSVAPPEIARWVGGAVRRGPAFV